MHDNYCQVIRGYCLLQYFTFLVPMNGNVGAVKCKSGNFVSKLLPSVHNQLVRMTKVQKSNRAAIMIDPVELLCGTVVSDRMNLAKSLEVLTDLSNSY